MIPINNYENKLYIPKIGLQNNKEFKLIQPKKGHYIKNLFFPGNKKSNFSKDTELILLDKEILKNKLNQDNNKYLPLDKSLINKENAIVKNILKHYNEKRNESKKENKTERSAYKNYNDYISRYLPGPCEYITEKDLNILSNKKNNRYKSLFNSSKNKSLKEKNNISLLGPGSYNISGNLLINNSHIGLTLNTREKRFKSNINKNSLGPGEYFKNDYNKKIFKIMNKNNIYRKIKNKCDLKINKYIITNEKKEYEVPGPGKYNFKSCFSMNNIKRSLSNEKIIPEKVLKEYFQLKRK